MMKMLVILILGATVLQTSALAQTRGQRDRNIPTRGEMDRARHYRPIYVPPPIIIHQRPHYPSYPPSAYNYRLSHLQANIYLIDDFARGLSSNCYVKLSVSGWANQVYLYGNISYQNGQFAGNFDNRSQVEYLRQTLINYVMNGTCNLAGY